MAEHEEGEENAVTSREFVTSIRASCRRPHAEDVAQWPAVRDVARACDVSGVYVHSLIHRGRLDAIQTRLGWLVDPASVAAYQAQRAAHPPRRLKKS